MARTITFDPDWQRVADGTLGQAVLSDKQLSRFLQWLYSNRYAVLSAEKGRYQHLLNRLHAELRRRQHAVDVAPAPPFGWPEMSRDLVDGQRAPRADTPGRLAPNPCRSRSQAGRRDR